MRRWLRRTRPPSKLRSRFLPTASTASAAAAVQPLGHALARPHAGAASRPRRARRPAPGAGAPRGGGSLLRHGSQRTLAPRDPARVRLILVVAVVTAMACGAQSSASPELRCDRLVVISPASPSLRPAGTSCTRPAKRFRLAFCREHAEAFSRPRTARRLPRPARGGRYAARPRTGQSLRHRSIGLHRPRTSCAPSRLVKRDLIVPRIR